MLRCVIHIDYFVQMVWKILILIEILTIYGNIEFRKCIKTICYVYIISTNIIRIHALHVSELEPL